MRTRLRSWARTWCERQIHRDAQVLGDRDLLRPAVVFAPHPDDETLGCGGTIARKRELGVSVYVVFMTDGSASHASLVPRRVLRGLRRQEGIAACEMLGVDRSHVQFLDFPDHELASHRVAAVARVQRILSDAGAAEVFVPHHHEPPADHRATHDVVLTAVRALRITRTIHEYPVWLWRHWPWANGPHVPWSKRPRAMLTQISCARSLMRDCKAVVPIARVLARKRAALACHRSQMVRLVPGERRWPILADVANGALLECLLRDEEIFQRSVVSVPSRS